MAKMRDWTKMYKSTFLYAFVLLCALASPLACQVPVSQAPPIKFQFFSNAGLPLAAGCLSTFQAGTTNPAATYTDSSGTSLNTQPIILDGSGRADIWIPNASFKFQLKSAGGVNCASGSTIWTVDNITGILGLLNLANTWTGQNTFNQPIVIAVNSNQIVTGLPGAQITLNFPAPAGNVTLNFPSTADTMVGRNTTDTLTLKTLTTPTITNPTITGGGSWAGSPSLTTPIFAAGTPTAAGSVGYGAGNLNVGNGAANNIIPFQTGAIVPGHLTSWNTGGVVQDAGFAVIPPANLLINATAPTISSGFGASATITTSNGPASFTINVGTGGAASSGTIALPTAANGWNCWANDITNPTVGGGISTKQTGSTVNTATFTGYNATPVATAWTASDILQVSCFGR